MKPIVFTAHARKRTAERGTREEDVIEAIRIGEREPAQRDLVLYRLNLEFHREWVGGIMGYSKLPQWWPKSRIASSSLRCIRSTFKRKANRENRV